MGFTGLYLIFLFLIQKHALWVLVRTASLYVCFDRKYLKKNQNFSNDIFIFSSEKNLCILHGQVFVMVVGPCQKVQVGNDQEKVQSERNSHSKNRGGKN